MTKKCLLCGMEWSGSPDELLCLIESNVRSAIPGMNAPTVSRTAEEVMVCRKFFERVHDESQPPLSHELLQRIPGIHENPRAAYAAVFVRAFSLAMSLR